MKTGLLFLFSLIFINNFFAQNVVNNPAVHIIPIPVALTVSQGFFQLNNSTAIISKSSQTAEVANLMANLLNVPTGFQLSVNKSQSNIKNNKISLQLVANSMLGDEGYTLNVSPELIQIEANKPCGLFYGLQTMMQLLPAAIESKEAVNSVKWEIPYVRILDYPRFGWRGLMLDVSRHFFSKQFIERYIDEMVKYKMNVFHWHLSDDNGWRIEIKGLPKLTDIGAWRVPRTGTWGTFDPAHPGEKATYGGYYTQEDIREVVAYAKKRFVTILPEIDVPGHSRALISAYPGLSCTKLRYAVEPGTRYFREDDNSLCVANDSIWLILDKIFTQVAALFPGEYIHVGGDEVHAEYWENDPREQALMKREGITSLEGLQRYFEKKLEKIIASKGKKMIGWYEIDHQLTSDAALMSWNSISAGIEAIKMGHHVVMAPTRYCYLDSEQGRVSDCYQFEPVPDGVDPKYVLGAQGCLWTERVPNERQAEYMTWPRSMALAEVFWSPKSRQNLNDFLKRMQCRFDYLDTEKVKYSRSGYDPVITGISGGRICQECDDSTKVNITTEIPGLDIFYTFDGTNPDNFYPRYKGKPLGIPKGASEIRVVTYSKGKPVGRQVNCLLTDVGQRYN